MHVDVSFSAKYISFPSEQVGHIVFGTVVQECKTSNIAREVRTLRTFIPVACITLRTQYMYVFANLVILYFIIIVNLSGGYGSRFLTVSSGTHCDNGLYIFKPGHNNGLVQICFDHQ